MPDLTPAVETIVRQCLNVRAGETVVVVTDPPSRAVGEALRDAAAGAQGEAVLVLMDTRAEHGSEPPSTVAAALRACDVFLAPTARSLSHTAARRQATEAGARGATLPEATADMLARVMDVDLERLGRRSAAVARLLDEGRQARLTCPRGSDLRLDIAGRRAVADDGRLTSPGSFGNLPCGEAFASPVSGEGTVVATSLASLGISSEPARLTVRDGHIVAGDGGVGPALYARLEAHGEPGRNLAELGVGTNDRAQVTGSVLEDEKVLGSVHVAFGRSLGLGGTVDVAIHLDVVVIEATLEIDGTRVLERGRFVLD